MTNPISENQLKTITASAVEAGFAEFIKAQNDLTDEYMSRIEYWSHRYPSIVLTAKDYPKWGALMDRQEAVAPRFSARASSAVLPLLDTNAFGVVSAAKTSDSSVNCFYLQPSYALAPAQAGQGYAEVGSMTLSVTSVQIPFQQYALNRHASPFNAVMTAVCSALETALCDTTASDVGDVLSLPRSHFGTQIAARDVGDVIYNRYNRGGLSFYFCTQENQGALPDIPYYVVPHLKSDILAVWKNEHNPLDTAAVVALGTLFLPVGKEETGIATEFGVRVTCPQYAARVVFD